MSQTADALQHSHDHQIVHQDIKPSNLLIRETSELLTGRPPFQGGSMQLMYQHLNVQPPAPSTLNPALPADVDTVLLHALAKEPAQRFASIAAFAQTLQQAVQHAGVTPRVEMPSPLSTPDFSREKDIYAALAISEVEAGNGTTRALPLPGVRRVRVAVPAGIQDGQIIRLEGQGEQAEAGGPMSALVLVITVKQTTDEVVHSGYASGTHGDADDFNVDISYTIGG